MEISGDDRYLELKEFDESKAGVKGLVDSGISTLPKMFIRTQEELAEEKTQTPQSPPADVQVPVIDLSCIESDDDRRKIIVLELKEASEKWGFLQVVNHGIPESVLDGMLDGILKFHELDYEVKKELYSRDPMMKVRYESNIDLYKSRSANWRDTMTINSRDGNLVELEVPHACRVEIVDYQKHVIKLGETLLELLSEALGLKEMNLNEMGCATSRSMVCHYYPACPEPHLTLGVSKHTDPAFLTVLLQDSIGGLQFLHDNRWTDVPPCAGSLIVNIGDLLQMLSNDKFKSVEHRVLANPTGPRISTACFFIGVSLTEKTYGPIKELISDERPSKYRDFTVNDYLANFFNRPIDKLGLDYYKI